MIVSGFTVSTSAVTLVSLPVRVSKVASQWVVAAVSSVAPAEGSTV